MYIERSGDLLSAELHLESEEVSPCSVEIHVRVLLE